MWNVDQLCEGIYKVEWKKVNLYNNEGWQEDKNNSEGVSVPVSAFYPEWEKQWIIKKRVDGRGAK
jgi:hypothetical protein